MRILLYQQRNKIVQTFVLFRIDIQNILKQKQTLDSKVGNDDIEYTCALNPIRA